MIGDVFNIVKQNEILVIDIEDQTISTIRVHEINFLQSDFFPHVTYGEVDFTEASSSKTSFDGVAIKRCVASGVGKFHGIDEG